MTCCRKHGIMVVVVFAVKQVQPLCKTDRLTKGITLTLHIHHCITFITYYSHLLLIILLLKWSIVVVLASMLHRSAFVQ